jgi:hypothetical protein
MDAQRKKELTEQYKNRKPAMGIFAVCCKLNNKCFLQQTKDFRAGINGTKMRLQVGFHTNKELQKEWKSMGEDNFDIIIYEELEHKDEFTDADYAEELELLRKICEEKIIAQGKELYKQKG